jgi:hypothetical protein
MRARDEVHAHDRVDEQETADSRARGAADESSRDLEETNDENREVSKETREHHDANFFESRGVTKVAKAKL